MPDTLSPENLHSFSQDPLIKKLNAFYQTHLPERKDTLENKSMFDKGGFCYGLSLIYLHYATRGKQEVFWQLLNRLQNCTDADLMRLESPFDPKLNYTEDVQLKKSFEEDLQLKAFIESLKFLHGYDTFKSSYPEIAIPAIPATADSPEIPAVSARKNVTKTIQLDRRFIDFAEVQMMSAIMGGFTAKDIDSLLDVHHPGCFFSADGVYSVALSGSGGAHAVVIEVRQGNIKLFDPNYGEITDLHQIKRILIMYINDMDYFKSLNIQVKRMAAKPEAMASEQPEVKVSEQPEMITTRPKDVTIVDVYHQATQIAIDSTQQIDKYCQNFDAIKLRFYRLNKLDSGLKNKIIALDDKILSLLLKDLGARHYIIDPYNLKAHDANSLILEKIDSHRKSSGYVLDQDFQIIRALENGQIKKVASFGIEQGYWPSWVASSKELKKLVLDEKNEQVQAAYLYPDLLLGDTITKTPETIAAAFATFQSMQAWDDMVFLAAALGDNERLQRALEAGGSLVSPHRSQTALEIARKNQHPAVVQLLEQEANTLLLTALQPGNLLKLQTALQAGANLDVTDGNGQTVVMLANQIADSDVKTKVHQQLIDHQLWLAIRQHDIPQVKEALEQGGSLTAEVRPHGSMLLWVSQHSSEQFMGNLWNLITERWQDNPDPIQRQRLSQEALTIAAILGDREKVAWALDHQANLSYQDTLGRTAADWEKSGSEVIQQKLLLAAIDQKDWPQAKQLLQKLTDSSLREFDHTTQQHVQNNDGFKDIFFSEKLYRALDSNNWTEADTALAQISTLDQLHVAAINQLAQSNPQQQQWLLNRVLWHAAIKGNREMMKTALHAGADIGYQNETGEPLTTKAHPDVAALVDNALLIKALAEKNTVDMAKLMAKKVRLSDEEVASKEMTRLANNNLDKDENIKKIYLSNLLCDVITDHIQQATDLNELGPRMLEYMKRGADIHTPTSRGTAAELINDANDTELSVLFWRQVMFKAAFANQEPLFQEALAHGADPYGADKDGKSIFNQDEYNTFTKNFLLPILLAELAAENISHIQKFFSAGCPILLTNGEQGQTLLSLLQSSENTEIQALSGNILNQQFLAAVKQENYDLVQDLLTAGADIHTDNDQAFQLVDQLQSSKDKELMGERLGNHLLWEALATKNSDMLKQAFAVGANILERDLNDQSINTLAMQTENPEIILLCQEQLNQQLLNEIKPGSNWRKVVELLENGADFDCHNGQAFNLLKDLTEASYSYIKIKEILVDKLLLTKALTSGDITKVQLALTLDVNLLELDEDEQNILQQIEKLCPRNQIEIAALCQEQLNQKLLESIQDDNSSVFEDAVRAGAFIDYHDPAIQAMLEPISNKKSSLCLEIGVHMLTVGLEQNNIELVRQAFNHFDADILRVKDVESVLQRVKSTAVEQNEIVNCCQDALNCRLLDAIKHQKTDHITDQQVLSQINTALKLGADLGTTDSHDGNLLNLSQRYASPKLQADIKKLLHTALIEAISHQDLLAIKQALTGGADLTVLDQSKQQSVLQIAVKNHDSDLVKLLQPDFNPQLTIGMAYIETEQPDKPEGAEHTVNPSPVGHNQPDTMIKSAAYQEAPPKFAAKRPPTWWSMNGLTTPTREPVEKDKISAASGGKSTTSWLKIGKGSHTDQDQKPSIPITKHHT